MLKIWDRAEQTLAGMLGIAALALALWQVISRYFFPQNSISYAEEAIVYLVIWAIMIVSSQLVRADGHVRPDLVLNIVPAGAKRWMEAFNSVAAFVFCAGLVWYGWQVVGTALLIDEHGASDLRFPMWIYYAALPAGGAPDVDALPHQARRACVSRQVERHAPAACGRARIAGYR